MVGITGADKPQKHKRHVTFSDDAEIINPEDVDPSISKFRNIIQTTIIPTKVSRVLRIPHPSNTHALSLSLSPSHPHPFPFFSLRFLPTLLQFPPPSLLPPPPQQPAPTSSHSLLSPPPPAQLALSLPRARADRVQIAEWQSAQVPTLRFPAGILRLYLLMLLETTTRMIRHLSTLQ